MVEIRDAMDRVARHRTSSVTDVLSPSVSPARRMGIPRAGLRWVTAIWHI
jgi:hypothetical protein